MTKIAMFTGSFDPITNGHMDIIVRAHVRTWNIEYKTIRKEGSYGFQTCVSTFRRNH